VRRFAPESIPGLQPFAVVRTSDPEDNATTRRAIVLNFSLAGPHAGADPALLAKKIRERAETGRSGR